MRLVYFVLAWVAGIYLSAQFPNIPPLVWLILMFGATIVAIIGQSTRYRLFWFCLLWFTLGALRFSIVPKTSDIAFYNGQNVSIEGIVADEPDVRDDNITLRLEAKTVFDQTATYMTNGVVLVSVPRITQVSYGDRIKVGGQLRLPAEYDTFSYTDYLARDGIFSLMRNATVEVIGHDEGIPFFSAIFAFKAQTQQVIAERLPEPFAGLLTGILVGNQRGLSPQLGDAFSAVGASHIIAISGFNMAIVSGVVMGLLDRLRVGKRLAALMGISFLVIYTLMVGAGATVTRAALMSSLLIIAPLFNRKTYIPATLACVVLVLTLQNPSTLWDVSFQLSFFAVLGLALFVTPLQRGFDRLLLKTLPTDYARTASSFLSDSLIVTIAAQIATLPLMLLYFQKLSLVSLPVNLLIIPVQSVLMILGALATLLGFLVPPLAQILFWFDMLLLWWTIAVVRWFATLPFASTSLSIDARLVGFYYLMLVGGAIMVATRPAWFLRLGQTVRSRPIFNAVVASGVGVVCLLVAMILSRPDGQLHVWWLDVGHSNAVFFQTPQGAQILIDGGRYPSRLLTAIGDRMPFYDRQIDLLVMTQPDDFDNGAIPSVLSRYDVGAVIVNGQPNQSQTQTEIATALNGKAVVQAVAGYEWTTSDGVRFEVLNPKTTPLLGEDLGNGALVLRVTYGERSILLTSDLNVEGQFALLDTQYPLADIMTLPDHGAARSLSEAFLATVQPSLVVLQSDLANGRGDPNGDTLNLLGQIPLIRTDKQGSLHLYTDGQSVWYVGEKSS